MLSQNSMLKSKLSFAVIFVLIVFVVKTKAQSDSNLKVISCPIDSCEFAVEFKSSEEPKMIFKTHMQTSHNIELSEDEVEAKIKSGSYQNSDSEVKFIECPFGDVFKLYSKNSKELVFLFGSHSKIVHEKELKDSEILEMIIK